MASPQFQGKGLEAFPDVLIIGKPHLAAQQVGHGFFPLLQRVLLFVLQLVQVSKGLPFEDGLQAQITNAGRILERVRSYAKHGAVRDNTVDLSALARSAIEELVQSKRLRAPVDFHAEGAVYMRGDEVELRILVHNIVKNAAEAAAAHAAARASAGAGTEADTHRRQAPVRVVVRTAPSETDSGKRRAEFCVENDGPEISQADLARLGEPLHSSKKEGLGLGLLICKSIAEAHRAKLLFEARTPEEGGGLRVRFRAELAAPEEAGPERGEAQRE